MRISEDGIRDIIRKKLIEKRIHEIDYSAALDAKTGDEEVEVDVTATEVSEAPPEAQMKALQKEMNKKGAGIEANGQWDDVTKQALVDIIKKAYKPEEGKPSLSDVLSKWSPKADSAALALGYGRFKYDDKGPFTLNNNPALSMAEFLRRDFKAFIDPEMALEATAEMMNKVEPFVDELGDELGGFWSSGITSESEMVTAYKLIYDYIKKDDEFMTNFKFSMAYFALKNTDLGEAGVIGLKAALMGAVGGVVLLTAGAAAPVLAGLAALGTLGAAEGFGALMGVEGWDDEKDVMGITGSIFAGKPNDSAFELYNSIEGTTWPVSDYGEALRDALAPVIKKITEQGEMEGGYTKSQALQDLYKNLENPPAVGRSLVKKVLGADAVKKVEFGEEDLKEEVKLYRYLKKLIREGLVTDDFDPTELVSAEEVEVEEEEEGVQAAKGAGSGIKAYPVVEEIQEIIGAKVDGKWGPETNKKWGAYVTQKLKLLNVDASIISTVASNWKGGASQVSSALGKEFAANLPGALALLNHISGAQAAKEAPAAGGIVASESLQVVITRSGASGAGLNSIKADLPAIQAEIEEIVKGMVSQKKAVPSFKVDIIVGAALIRIKERPIRIVTWKGDRLLKQKLRELKLKKRIKKGKVTFTVEGKVVKK